MVEKDKEQQFMEAYDSYSDAIFRYCYYRVFDREKAKDFVQETYCRAWKYIAGGKVIDDVRPFLYKIARNLIIDESRKRKNFSLDLAMEKGFAPKIDTRKKNEDYLAGKELVIIVKSLDEKYRDVILMKYIEDLSTNEIASILGETENNVYVRLSRGFDQVRDIVKKQELSISAPAHGSGSPVRDA